MRLCLRAGFILALLLCNVLFFLDIEARPDRVMALAFGGEEQPSSQRPDQSILTTMKMKQSRSYGFSQPAGTARAPR